MFYLVLFYLILTLQGQLNHNFIEMNKINKLLKNKILSIDI